MRPVEKLYEYIVDNFELNIGAVLVYNILWYVMESNDCWSPEYKAKVILELLDRLGLEQEEIMPFLLEEE